MSGTMNEEYICAEEGSVLDSQVAISFQKFLGCVLLLSLYALKNYLFLAVPGLHCCLGFYLVAETRGYSLVAVYGCLIAVASCFRAQALGGRASVAAAQRLHSCGSWTGHGAWA